MCIEVCRSSAPPFPTSSIPRPLLVHHVARRLGLSCRMVRHLAETGALRAHKAGSKIWNFLPADVEEFRMRREVQNG
jgi:hypothetical protein